MSSRRSTSRCIGWSVSGPIRFCIGSKHRGAAGVSRRPATHFVPLPCAPARFSDPVRSVFGHAFRERNHFRFCGLSLEIGGIWAMLVERGVRVLNKEVVGDAYHIASNYLGRTGAIADPIAINERLLTIIVQLFQHGEINRIRLANLAIAKFEAAELG